MKDLRIMTAFQNTADRDKIKKVLKRDGLSCSLLSYDKENSQEIDWTSLIKNNKIDFFLADINALSELDKDNLLKVALPIILFSHYTDLVSVKKLLENSFIDYLIKSPQDCHLDFLATKIKNNLQLYNASAFQKELFLIEKIGYKDLIQALPDIVYIVSEEGYFTYLNEAIQRFGYSPEDLIGLHFSCLLKEEDIPRVSRHQVLPKLEGMSPEKPPALFNERRGFDRLTQALVCAIRPKIKSETEEGPFFHYGEICSVGVPENRPGKYHSIGIIRDITEKRRAEMKLADSIREKEILVHENQHKVINNLQIIASLLRLQKQGSQNREENLMISESILMVQSMLLVQDHLYLVKHQDKIDFYSFIESVLLHFIGIFNLDRAKIKYQLLVNDIRLSGNTASPLAILICEVLIQAIIVQCVKTSGKLTLHFQNDDKRYHLKLEWNPEREMTFKKHMENPVRQEIIQALVMQLDGNYSLSLTEIFTFNLDFPV